jgi:hypothetical protein
MTTHDQQTTGGGRPQEYPAEDNRYGRLPEEPATPTQPSAEASPDVPTTAPRDPRLADAGTRHDESADDGYATRSADLDHGSQAGRHTDGNGGLFADDELAGLKARWDAVQSGFVDDPRDCVQKADGLVADLVQQLTTGFGQARSRLEEQWSRGEQASTEDLRVALQRYRSFFERLLSV